MRFLLPVLLIFLSCGKPAPFDLAKLESKGPVALPCESPDNWLIAHIDVETTGLLPGYHEMIDIGIVMTDLDGNIVDSLFLLIQPEHPKRLAKGAYAVNAFDTDKWRRAGALSKTAAVARIVNFHRQVAGDKQVLMAAYNCQFDTAFLDHLFRSANRSWRELYYYYVLDIPSMAWGLGFRDLNSRQLMAEYNIADEPHIAHLHTGITGAMKNVRLYRALQQHRRSLSRN